MEFEVLFCNVLHNQFLPRRLQRSGLVLSDLDSPNKLIFSYLFPSLQVTRLSSYRAVLNYKAVVPYSEKLIER